MIQKDVLKDSCLERLLQKMNETKVAMQAAQESANSEEKSSMGDKYETGRAMSQLERDRIAAQLSVLQQEFKKLQMVDIAIPHPNVQVGALVQTETQWYWIAVSLGQVQLDTEKIMVVSPVTPIAKVLIGLKKGSTFSFNGKKQKVLKVY